ncbi:hypothetical protein ACHAXS_004743, partial [Conticribra weissflogii]
LNCKPTPLEEGLQLGKALVKPLLFPLNSRLVHLVDYYDQIRHPQRLSQKCVFTSLTALIKPRFELSLPRRNHQNADICLRCSHNHIRNVVFMSWRIHYSVALGFSLEPGPSNFNGFSLRTLLLIGVHNEC